MKLKADKICPFCNLVIREEDNPCLCSSCGEELHLHCWQENQGCTTLGCPYSGRVYTKRYEPASTKQSKPVDTKSEKLFSTERPEISISTTAEPTTEELRLFVGKKADYYLRKWEGIKEFEYLQTLKTYRQRREFLKGKNYRLLGTTYMNGGAFLGGVFWLVYRKMYLYAFLLFLGCLGIEIIMVSLEEAGILSPNFTFPVGSFITGFCGNWLYYRHAKKEIARIKAKHLPPEIQKIEIVKAGGTNIVAALLCALIFIFISILFILGKLISSSYLPE